VEQRLRSVEPARQHDPAVRVMLFEGIAADFLAAVDHNLRTRALIFTPFFHPLLFVKTLLLRAARSSARALLIQAEYDRFFYHGDTLDQLPAVTPDRAGSRDVLYGPRLVMNTTALLTGERVAFFREPVSGALELSKVNRNVLPLARVVGASSGVPVVFPPTRIAGDALVDGGVSDNQGTEALLDPASGCGVLLISDASGQMEEIDSITSGAEAVYSRANDIFQHQVRARNIERLIDWRSDSREFAFVHLFLNLKDRSEVTHRVSSEFIPAIGRIRTDLDQFDYIEREALMYHGYTLIDAQLRTHCPEFLERRFGGRPMPPMAEAPLFREEARRLEAVRKTIRMDLEQGHKKLFLLRSLAKHPAAVGSTMAAGLAAAAAIGWSLWKALGDRVTGLAGWVAAMLAALVLLYVILFAVYESVRIIVLRLDRREYRAIAGADPSVAWPVPPRAGAAGTA
jgi:hypothetical protein